ncbi:GbsR/MarR family transcriptional regulator [Lutibacter citreus]|uniref:GbsR/MarR family transcriptional regulator n=1 Tax=Lutibacter citreus TaxID=2138210 RepID=UPI000DBE3600|nr:transcriptional regulator [Lutibacter citreus]
MNKEFEQKRKELIEKLGVFLEEHDQFAPLAARILATTILYGKRGVTFDQLVSNLCASKSTISTHLTNLQSQKEISYFTKPGDRKKYFKVNKNRLLNKIDDTIAMWNRQKDIHKEVRDYKNAFNNLEDTCKDSLFDCHFHDEYIVFFDQAQAAISVLREKILSKIEIENKNN